MTVKSVGLWAVVGILVSAAVLHGQDYNLPKTENLPEPGIQTLTPPPDPTAPPGATPIPSLSKYILGSGGDCCGPLGKHGPIDLEIFLRVGETIPIEGGILRNTLESGWMFEAGGRSLFFDASDTAAWTIDLSATNMWNH